MTDFDKIINFRDLGGLPVGKKTVRPMRLLRSAHLSDASPSDISRLQNEYRLRKIFDFRTYPEAESAPDKVIPGAEHILLPTLDEEEERRSGEAVPAQTWLNLPKHIVQLSFTALFQKKARELYPSLVLSEYSQLQYAAFLNMILETPDGAVIWHCSQGKDRTGIGAAFVLSALGADRETIIADFDLSNRQYAPIVNELCAQVQAQGGGEDEMDVVRAFMGVSTRNFRAALAMIDERWGSMDTYLEQCLGINAQDRMLLQSRYLQ
ncbi:MAG: tyrosine-protein phosphatase [Bacteroidales bacterium]|nr:tyrosine-protein phosphatase [Bacteroidales bacterium]